ncbi:fibronectin type III domain protein [Leptospira ryugenii]|uniref:Fibronectin type III domain protein n=1 Tax=Leptospira ryugenii TaxID=1917863 RepID=A0A2P2E434_9LEPT|nr:hypothetical protein [Leptospira ryugenii]GBF51641.1 fibronectin type III domain protein [Leptospira ryugenii]
MRKLIFALLLSFGFSSCAAVINGELSKSSTKGFVNFFGALLGAVSPNSTNLEDTVVSTPVGSGEVTSTGTTLRSNDGMITIDFPEGAVDSNIEFQISRYTPEDTTYPSSYVPTSPAYIISPSYKFKKPVTISMSLDTTKIQSLNLEKSNSLAFSYSTTSAEENAGKMPSWSMHQTSVNGDKVVFTTNTFSIFGLASPPIGNRAPINSGAFYVFKPGCSFVPYMIRTQVIDPDGDALEVYLLTGPKNGGSFAIRMTREGSTNWYSTLIPYEAISQAGIKMQISAKDSFGNTSFVPGNNVFIYPESSNVSTFISGYDIDADNDGLLCVWERDNGRSDTTSADASSVIDSDSDGIPNSDDTTPNGEANPQIDSLTIFPSEVTMDLSEKVLFGVSASYLGNPRMVNANITANGIGLNGSNIGNIVANVFTPSVPGSAAVTATVDGRNAQAVVVVRDSLGPNNITDLIAFATSQNRGRLEWTAPGDDGSSGKAAGYLIFRSLNPITNNATCTGTLIPHGLVPKQSGARESLNIAGLVPNTDYYFCIKAMDDSGNFNQWPPMTVSLRTFSAPDTSPPSEITSLTATALGSSQIQLSWNAVGDDGGTGIASVYEIYRSTGVIATLDSCQSSIAVSHAVTPVAAGLPLNAVVSGLSDNTQYFFCVIAYDDVGNVSNWTSVVSASTSRTNLTPTVVMNIYQLEWGKGDSIQLRAIVADGDASACNANISNYLYEWEVTSKPTNSSLLSSNIINRNTLNANVIPDRIGRYTFQIKFTDDPGICGGVAKTAVASIVLNVIPKFSWARSITTGLYGSTFDAVTTDPNGNIYAAGTQRGQDNYTYGPGVTATSPSANSNSVLVKYDSAGNALWARSVSNSVQESFYSSVATDSAGNVYVAGGQNSQSSFHYGSGVFLTGTTNGWNPTLVKYDPNGNALWAKSLVGSSGSYSTFSVVKVDNNGNVYVGGYQDGETYNYGSGPIRGVAGFRNLFIVKYDANGTAVWARTVTTSPGHSEIKGLAIDTNGDVIAVGVQEGNGNVQFGNSIHTTPSTGPNPFVLKINSFGNLLFYRTITSNQPSIFVQGGATFNSVALDIQNQIYVVGTQYPNTTVGYAIGTTLSTNSQERGIILSYAANGTFRWLRAGEPNGSFSSANFYSVFSDVSGNVYAAGSNAGSATFDYGNGVKITFPMSTSYPILLKLNSQGIAQWIKSMYSGDGGLFLSTTLDMNDSVIVSGSKRTNVYFESNQLLTNPSSQSASFLGKLPQN